MATAKLVVMYPVPNDLAAFEQAYSIEHIPMAAAVFKKAGATKAVLTKVIDSPAGTSMFHRVAEIHFPSVAALQACAESEAGRQALAHAHKISNGGAPTIFVAEEDVVNLLHT